jgi:hypothetical protein
MFKISPNDKYSKTTVVVRTRLILISCALEDSVQLERKRQLVARLSRVVVVDQLQDKIVQPYLLYLLLNICHFIHSSVTLLPTILIVCKLNCSRQDISISLVLRPKYVFFIRSAQLERGRLFLRDLTPRLRNYILLLYPEVSSILFLFKTIY